MDWMTMLIWPLLLEVKDFLIGQAIDDSVDSFLRHRNFYFYCFLSFISGAYSYLKSQLLPPSGVVAGPWPTYKYFVVAIMIYLRIAGCCRKLYWVDKLECGVFHLLKKHRLRSVLVHTLKKFDVEDERFFEDQLKRMDELIGRMSKFEQELEKIHTSVEEQPRFPAFLESNLRRLSNLTRVQSAQRTTSGAREGS